ncbi:hypothetical protein [Vibrio salinus]|uniref:hypothetical protein n=1 Tax=Vibrio salinus TaxID=2899784 RepID=UPI003563B813
MLRNINADISGSMSYVRRAQGLTFQELGKRITGISSDTFKRYMQQSYPSMRPIHTVAAFSWITMVPMTAFYYGFRIKEFYRGMDDHAVEALVCLGRLPANMLNTFLTMICHILTEDSKEAFFSFRERVELQYGKLEDHSDYFPPEVLDINEFAIDYYRSVAITAKRFREKNQIPIDTISRVLGLSEYQYSVLENPNKINHFSVSIGFRIKLGFKLEDHVYFSSEMKQFSDFYKLRKIQHVRDLLVVEALRMLNEKDRKYMTHILIKLSEMYK